MGAKKIFALTIICLAVSEFECDREFPDNFKFGVATSAYQIEGAWDEDGKGVNVWDALTQLDPSLIADGSNGDVACDSYHNYEVDVEMLKNLSVNYYRFSLSWTRLFPTGYVAVVNPAGVDYYNNLINSLLANGIEPLVTLYHWDSPLTFLVYGVWTNELLEDLFGEYATAAFQLFGDRVKTWLTFNEPLEICVYLNEELGDVIPLYPNGTASYDCARTIVKAHAQAYHIYDTQFRFLQQGRISITLSFDWDAPASNSTEDIEAAEQRRQFEFGLFANPIFNYNWPQIVIDRVGNRSELEGYSQSRLPQFSDSEISFIHGTFDFLGLNHYQAWLVEATPDDPIGSPSFASDEGTYRYQPSTWENTGSAENKVTPWALTAALRWIKETYNSPEILITECGYSDTDGTLEDYPRIDYLAKYLNATLDAIYTYDVNVTAFTTWSLMDNWEWLSGYTLKYGLYFVDFNSTERTRTPKLSAAYYKSVITSRVV